MRTYSLLFLFTGLIHVALSQAQANAVAPVAPTSLPLVEIFSSLKNPGRGTLEFVRGEEKETITFGTENGHYLMGMVFENQILPKTLQVDFKKRDLVQLAFGNFLGGSDARVGQFGAATLVVQQNTQAERLLPLRPPSNGEAAPLESAFLLFTSPSSNAQLSEEEKLKSTYFGKEGYFTLRATAPPKKISVLLDSQKVPFKMQAMRLEIQGKLGTPFNSGETGLTGSVEFPLYWPDGKEGRRLAKQLAESSFNAKARIEIPAELATMRRQVTAEPAREPRMLKPTQKKN